MCRIVPVRFVVPLPSWGPRGCLGDSRPLSSALPLRGWGLPGRALGGSPSLGRSGEQRLSSGLRPRRLAPPPVCSRWLVGSLRFDVCTSSQGQPSLGFRQLLLRLPPVDVGSLPSEPRRLSRVSSWFCGPISLSPLLYDRKVVCAD